MGTRIGAIDYFRIKQPNALPKRGKLLPLRVTCARPAIDPTGFDPGCFDSPRFNSNQVTRGWGASTLLSPPNFPPTPINPMFATRFAVATAATLLTGAAVAALTVVSPFGQFAQKTKHHTMVTQAAGQWAGTITVHNPAMPEPMVSDCTESVQKIGDLWTVSNFKAPFGGMNFHGSSTFGYDTDKKKFVGTWVDSMTTSFTQMEGVYNEERKAIVLDYKMKDQATGEMKDARMVIRSDKENSSSMFYLVEEGQEILTMEIEMTRQKTVEAAAEKAADAVEEAIESVDK